MTEPDNIICHHFSDDGRIPNHSELCLIVMPAGVGHKRLEASEDFQVVGAYPGGQKPDILRPDEEVGDLQKARQRIAEVPLPDKDPVYGGDGPRLRHWRS